MAATDHRLRLAPTLRDALHRGRGGAHRPSWQPDYNAASQAGRSVTTSADPQGSKRPAARAFLKPAMGRPTWTVITRAHATELVFEGKWVVGGAPRRCARRPGREVVRGEVIVAAGGAKQPKPCAVEWASGPRDPPGHSGVPLRHELPRRGRQPSDHSWRSVARVKRGSHAQ